MIEQARYLAHRVGGALLTAIAGLLAQVAIAQQTESAPSQTAPGPKLEVGSGVDTNTSAIEAYVLIESMDQQWKIVEISPRRLSVTKPATQELLVFANRFSFVEPFFSEYYQFVRRKRSSSERSQDPPADPYVCFSGEKKERPKYNPCDSKLTYASDGAKTALANTVMSIFSLGTANLLLGLGSAASVDRDKILAILKETNAVEIAKQYMRQVTYRSTYTRAKTVADYRTFINRYKDDDPEGFVPGAETRIAEIEAAEKAKQLETYRNQHLQAKTSADLRAFIERYESNDPDLLIPQARKDLKSAESEERRQAKEAEVQARKQAAAEAEWRKQQVAALAAWRGRLRIGDDTFCGPVIELRQPMVKIAVRTPLPGYAAEAWLKANEIYPIDAGCENINGRLNPIRR